MELAILIALIFAVNVVFGGSGTVPGEASGQSLTIDCGNSAIQIDSANYGSNCNAGSDQKANLGLYCDGFPKCTYLVAHGIIGDPAGGCRKTYVYGFTCTSTQVPDAQEYGVVAREATKKTLSINCGDAQITIVSAMYGRNCNVDRNSDETAHLGAACNGETTCEYFVDHDVIGDPAGGCPKEYDYVYTCANPCTNAGCDDGDPCNGEEYCEAGVCVPGEDMECERAFYCEAEVGCVRDCGNFAIDGYLRDCSLEFEDNENELSFIGGEIKRVDNRISATETRISDNTDDIETNDFNISELQARCDFLEAEVAELTARINDFAPLAGKNPPEARGQSVGVGPGEFNFDAFWYTHQVEIMFALILTSVLLVVSLCWMCCSERKKEKYSRVRIYDTDREDVGLNRKQ
jgi:uncharacterized coiled-coil protein SlyX